MQPPEPEDYDYFEEENMDHFMEDEEALEALREAEQEQFANANSPAKKRMKFDSVIPPVANEGKISTLEDITNREELDDRTLETTKASYRIPCLGERKVYRRIPMDGDYQTLTHSDGERFYLRIKNDESQESDPMAVLKKSKNFTGLLNYKDLLEAAVTEQIRLQEAENSTEPMEASEADSGLESEPVSSADETEEGNR